MCNYKQICLQNVPQVRVDQIQQTMGQSLSCYFAMIHSYVLTQNADAVPTSCYRLTDAIMELSAKYLVDD